MARFDGLVVLVTGAGGGLGNAMADAFAAEGARVIAADLDPDRIVTDAVVRAARLDVTREEEWVALLDGIAAAEGRIDVVVNNAGIFRPNIPFEEMPLSLWREHLAVNADGTFLGCKHGILRMKGHGGAIVNIASGMGVRPVPTASAYCASKAAVLMTTRTAAAAAGSYGIRVNAVLPGAVPTSMLMGNLQPGQSEADLLAILAGHSVLNRLATAGDIARAVLFLADPANSAITGVALPVDGGNLG